MKPVNDIHGILQLNLNTDLVYEPALEILVHFTLASNEGLLRRACASTRAFTARIVNEDSDKKIKPLNRSS